MKNKLILLITLLFAMQSMAQSLSYTADDGNTYLFDLISDGQVELVGNGSQYTGDAVVPGTITVQGQEYAVTSIGTSAFYNCHQLLSVSLPPSIEIIRQNAFGWCPLLSRVLLGQGVAEIAPYAFNGCPSLLSIDAPAANPCFKTTDGVLYSKDGTALLYYPGGKHGSYYIPSTATSIAEGAFYDCQHLTGIQIPMSVTSIGRNAFYYCGGLNEVAIASSVDAIGRAAFGECSQLKSISVSTDNQRYATDGASIFLRSDSTLVQYAPYHGTDYAMPSWTRRVGPEAFFRCYDLQTISLPDSVTTIDDAAFAGCWELRSLVLPASLDSIGFGAFAMCEGLNSIYAPQRDPGDIKLGDCAFYGVNTSSCTLYVPRGSASDYHKASQWGEFRVIKEYERLKEQHIVWDQDFAGCEVGQGLWLEAMATSDLPVEYEIVEGEELAMLAGSRLRMLQPGHVTIKASQMGDSRFLPAQSVCRSLDIALSSLYDATECPIHAIGGDGFITIIGAQIDDVACIFTIDGILAYEGKARSILLPSGAYIVKVNGYTTKLWVK